MRRRHAILVAFICSITLLVPLFTGTQVRAAMRYSAVAPADERFVDPAPLSSSVSGTAEAASVGAEGADAGGTGFNPFAILKKRIIQAWESDEYDLYLPAYTWHNRFMYDSVSRYNEFPWGGGFGRSFRDEDGDSHSLYFMGFVDSNYQFQPIGGYAYIKNWYLDSQKDWAVGLGYTLSITARHEYDYIPLPLPLPLASLQYKQFAIQATYIPSHYNDGNVLFAWLRWHFE